MADFGGLVWENRPGLFSPLKKREGKKKEGWSGESYDASTLDGTALPCVRQLSPACLVWGVVIAVV